MLTRQRGCTPGWATGVVEALEQRTLLDASLLRDVNTVMEPISVPADFIDLNGVLLFHTRTDRGTGLFRSDGTAAGTAQIATLDVGMFDASGVFGGVLYFGASDAATGQELWKTDGTAAGTVRVKDIYPGFQPSSPRLFRVAGGRLLFVATDPGRGGAFWTTDGTEAGTVVAYDPGPFNSVLGIDGFSAIGQSLYFSTSVPGIGTTVWESDAAFGNVRRLRDFPFEYRADSFTAAGDRVVFRAGSNLWSTDGTPEGTLPIRGGAAPTSILQAEELLGVGPTVYFAGFTGETGFELWKTDGTDAGTVVVRDLQPGPLSSLDSVNSKAVLGGAVYFETNNGTWRTDGSFDGTTRVSTLDANGIVASGGAIYFSAAGGLWKTDAAGSAAVLVRQFAGGLAQVGRAFGGGVAFMADDGIHNLEPWFSDGTLPGTVMLGDPDSHTFGSVPDDWSPTPVSLTDRVLFTADLTGGRSLLQVLYVTDGTGDGTRRLSAATAVVGLTRMGDAAYFFAAAYPGTDRLWRSDGTPGGTRPLLDTMFNHGTPAAVGQTLYFGAETYTAGRLSAPGLYRSDGTAAGTVLIKSMPAGRDNPANITAVGNVVYFTTFYDGNAFELWKTDGTAAGTVVVNQFTGGPPSYVPASLVDMNGKLVMRTYRGLGSDQQVWASDGTALGTVALGAFAAQAFDVNLTVCNGAAYFAAATVAGDLELWKTDGTAESTVRVKEITPGIGGSNPGTLTTFNGRLYFAASDPTGGNELWSTDGTEVGTSRVLDLLPGSSGSVPTIWGEVAGRLYFTANDGQHGYELWSTDGTAAGTEMIDDVNPGAGSGSSASQKATPVALNNAAAGNRLVFWGNDGVRGTEPWSAPLPGAAEPFVVGRHVFYNNGRFDGRDPAPNSADDGAIAADKQALGFGESPSFQNVTSYARGINGLMVDLTTRFDFFDEVHLSFKVGAGGDPAAWVPGPAPLSVTHRTDGVPEDVDRVTVVWADGAIRNTWLQVTADALLGGRVVASDVFYFGNLVGETDGNPALRVNAAVYATTRGHLRENAQVDNPYDFNRDGRVDALDLNAVRGNLFKSLGAIAGPPPPSAATSYAAYAPAATRSGVSRRRSWLQKLTGSPNTALP